MSLESFVQRNKRQRTNQVSRRFNYSTFMPSHTNVGMDLTQATFAEPVRMENVYLLHQYFAEQNDARLADLVRFQHKLETENGVSICTYSDRGHASRVYPNVTSIGQGMSRAVRGALCFHLDDMLDESFSYIDLDIVNAMPTIMKEVFERNNMDCEALKLYCLDREMLFGRCENVDRKHLKALFCAMMNGLQIFRYDAGFLENKYWREARIEPLFKQTVDVRKDKDGDNDEGKLNLYTFPEDIQVFVRQFAYEMHDNAIRLFDLLKIKNKRFIHNVLGFPDGVMTHHGKFMSKMYTYVERCILNTVIEFSDDKIIKKTRDGYLKVSLIHDGCMIYTGDEEVSEQQEFLDELSQYVYERLNIRVDFAAKDLDSSLALILRDFKEEVETRDIVTENVSGRTPFDRYLRSDMISKDVWTYLQGLPPKGELEQQEIVTNVLNKYFAWIENNNKESAVLCKTWEKPKGEVGFCRQFFVSKSNFIQKYMRYKVRVKINGDKIKLRNIVTLFLDSPSILSFERVIYRPSHDWSNNTGNEHNMFHGLAISIQQAHQHCMNNKMESESIDDYAKRKSACYVKLLREHVCGEHYKYLLHWLAHVIQKPGTKTKKRIDLFSAIQGTGKSLAIETVMKIIGISDSLKVTNLKRLQRFNNSIKYKILLFCDEAFFTGNKELSSMLKNLVTTDQENYEKKCETMELCDSFHNIVTANNLTEHAPITEVGDRRTIGYDSCSRFGGNPTEASTAFYMQIVNIELPALAYYLYTINLTGFNPMMSPTTSRTLTQIKMSLTPSQRFIFEMVRRGTLPYKARLLCGAHKHDSGMYASFDEHKRAKRRDFGLSLNEPLRAGDDEIVQVPRPSDWETTEVRVVLDFLHDAYTDTNGRRFPLEPVTFGKFVRKIFKLQTPRNDNRIKIGDRRVRPAIMPRLAEARQLFVEFVNIGRQTSWHDWVNTEPPVVYLDQGDRPSID